MKRRTARPLRPLRNRLSPKQQLRRAARIMRRRDRNPAAFGVFQFVSLNMQQFHEEKRRFLAEQEATA